MIQNYFKIAWRNILRNKGFSFINIFGLSIGLTACVFILLYVIDERSYDRHHEDGHLVYRIASEVKSEIYVGTSAPLAAGIKKDFPEVAQVTRLLRFPGIDKMVFKNDQTQQSFFETNCFYVDSTFFELFSYEFKFGNIHTALHQPNAIILAEEVANKLYGNTDPIGKVLNVGLSFGDFDYTVKGVIKNSNHKSHIPARVYLSMNNNDIGGWVRNQANWATNNIFHTYVKVKSGTDRTNFESKLQPFLDKNGAVDFKMAGFSKKIFLQPMQDIYLHSNFGFEIAPNGNVKTLYVFSCIAIFLLIIACINFMNLSTARSEKRANEVGMRKVVGALNSNLIQQFLTESILMSGLALFVTVVFIQLLLPFFNQLTNKKLALLDDPSMLWMVFGLTAMTGLVAGLYPAMYLASFKPLSVIKNKVTNNFSVMAVRKGLIVFQFVISTVLILSVFTINRQLEYLSDYNLGFNKNQKLVLPIQTNEAQKNILPLRNELKQLGMVKSMGKGATYPGKEHIQDMLFYAEGKTQLEHVDIRVVNTEEGYFETLGFELLNGRNFSAEFSADTQAIVINESAARQLGYAIDAAVGKKANYEFQDQKYSMQIIGVMKDYHFRSLQETIKPLAFSISPLFGSPNSYLLLDVIGEDYTKLIQQVQTIWNKMNPNSPFEYSFLDQDFQKNYEKETRSAQIFRAFTLIGILIACLGLFGLAAFAAEQRIKEVGVRKVLGASISTIVRILSMDFLKLVFMAIFIAFPIGYFVINKWLQGFAYKIDIEWWMFVLAGSSAICIALITISFQTIKAAIANPVSSLRSK